jgi:outer membrane protein assembly factor BamA
MRVTRRDDPGPHFVVIVPVLALLLDLLPGGQEPPSEKPPDFLGRKEHLPVKLLEKKSEGWYLTGFPMIGVDPELGPILGAQAQIFNNGPRGSPFFAYAPYRHQIQAGAQGSVQGTFRGAFVTYDEPYVDDSPWRFRSYVGYTQNKVRNYFGTGEQTLEHLHYPGSARSFQRLEDFKDAIESDAGGITWEKYVAYHQRLFVGAFNVEYDLWGGLLRPLAGIQISRVGVTDYTGRTIDGAIEQETKLAEDARLGRILGFDGGWDNSVRLGLAYDSRNYEPDPTWGVLAQTFVSGSLRAIGSEFDYGQATVGLTLYTPLLPDYDRLIAVGNATYSVRFGDVPFYAMNRMPLPKDEVRTGLGAFPTLRGYSSNRFVGRVTVGADAELRWSFAEFVVWDQQLKTALATFVDAGRVFDTAREFSGRDWKYSWGVGLRLAWNLATVISFDFGVGPEGNLFFMQVGQPF